MGLRVVFRTRPKIGEIANGDAGFVRMTEAHTMFAVLDALGHGVVAQAVADRARAALSGAALDRGVVSLIEQAHEALKGTRGAALTLGVHTAGTRSIELAGVGNVQVRSLRRSLPFVAAPGVVGSRVSRVRSTTIELLPDETVLIASDGLPRRTSATLEDAPDADALCERMLSLAHAHDDATVMLVRMERPQPC